MKGNDPFHTHIQPLGRVRGLFGDVWLQVARVRLSPSCSSEMIMSLHCKRRLMYNILLQASVDAETAKHWRDDSRNVKAVCVVSE